VAAAHHHHDVPTHTHVEDPLFAGEPEYSATGHIDIGTGVPVAAAASELDIHVGALRAVPRRSAEAMMTLAPGAVLTNHSGIGHASTLYLRGFDAGEGQDFELLVDGIVLNEPSNAHGHGYADSHFLIGDLVKNVRVLEGPFDARQGDFAVAGTMEMVLGLERRGVTVRGEYGSFDEKRLVALWGPEGASDGTFVGVSLTDGAGFGPNRAHQAVSAIGQFEERSGPFRWAVLGATHAQRFDAAGVIREDDYEARRLPCARDADAQFFCTYDPNQGGSGSRHLLGGRLEWKQPGLVLGQQLWLSLRNDRFRESFTGFLLAPDGDGLDEQYEATTAGLRGFLRTRTEAFGHPQRFEIGYLARHDDGRTRMWRVRREGRDPYAVVFDEDLAITNVALYATSELRAASWLAARVGVRVDSFGFSLVDRNRPTMDRTGPRLSEEAIDAFGVAVSPRGTVTVTLAPGLDWVTSIGLGARSTDAIALSEGERAPFARVVASETGLAYRASERRAWSLDARALAYQTWVSNDMLFDPERGRNVPIGESNRYGALATARVSVGDWLDTMASFTWAEAHTPPNDASIFDLGAGPRLPFVPRFVLRVDAAVKREVPLDDELFRVVGAVGVTWVGPRPLPLETLSDPLLSADASLTVGWRFVDLGLAVENVFDNRNQLAVFNYASNFIGPDATPSLRAERHFSAGAPRAFFATLTFHADTAWLTGAAQP
jgi:hypothetical protein